MTLAVLGAAITGLYTLLTHLPPKPDEIPSANAINGMWVEGQLHELIEQAPAAIDGQQIRWSGRAQIYRNLAWAHEELAEAAGDRSTRREHEAEAQRAWERLLAFCDAAPTEDSEAIDTLEVSYWEAFAFRGLGQEARARELWQGVAAAWLESESATAPSATEEPGSDRAGTRSSVPTPLGASQASGDSETPKESAEGISSRRDASTSRAAHAFGMLGEYEAAIEALTIAAVERNRLPDPDSLRRHRAFDTVSRTPRFRAITVWLRRTSYFDSVRRLLIERDHETLYHTAALQTEADPNDPDGWLSMGFALDELGWPENRPSPDHVWSNLLRTTQPNDDGRTRSYDFEHRAWALLGTGKPDEARRVFARVGEILAERIYDNIARADANTAHRAAAAFSMAGKTDRAVRMIAIAAGDPDFDRPWAQADPALEHARQHPGFPEAISPRRRSAQRPTTPYQLDQPPQSDPPADLDPPPGP